MSEIPPSDPGQEPEQPKTPENPSPEGQNPPSEGPPTPPIAPDPTAGYEQSQQYVAYPRGYYGMPPARTWDLGSIATAWELITKNWGIWAINGLIYFIAASIALGVYLAGFFTMIPLSTFTTGAANPNFARNLSMPGMLAMGLVFQIVMSTLQQLYIMGTCHMALKQMDTGSIDANDILNCRGRFGSVLAASLMIALPCAIVTQLLSCFGSLLVLFVLAALAFVGPMIVERGLSPVEAIKESYKVSMPAVAVGGLVVLLAQLVSGLGAIACGIGVIVTAPMVPLVMAVTYRRFFPLDQPAPVTQQYPF